MGQGALLLLAVAVMATRYTIELQGLFFVYLSLAVLFQLADLGLGYALVQIGSHLAAAGSAGLRTTFIRQARALGTGIALISLLWIGVGGAAVLHGGTTSSGHDDMLMKTWWALAIASATLQWANLELARLEGLHSAAAAWRTRLQQEWLGGAALVAALVMDAGLWSLTVQALARTAVAANALARYRIPATAHRVDAHSLESFSWRREVWPFQWRIGLSALAGYLIFQAYNPILLVQQGPASAGRFGFSLAIMNMLLMVTTAWPLSQSARWAGWLSQGKRREAQAAFMRTFRASSLLAAAAAVSTVFGLALVQHLGLPLAQRSADLLTTALLLLLGWVHHVVSCVAVLLRAQRQEPLLVISVLGALLNALVVFAAANFGQLWVVAAASLAVALAGLVFTGWLYRCFVAEDVSKR
jgi:hypothetical protein